MVEKDYASGDLEELLWKARSLENIVKNGGDPDKTEFIGSVRRGRRLYDIYKDRIPEFWYTVRIQTDQGIVSEHEAVFGYPDKRAHARKRIDR